ncbi:MAG TPA: DMT family transporter [Dehalococcoidia bacterium]|nr:DMT family transporter [Dehalococcoidia bacterium]
MKLRTIVLFVVLCFLWGAAYPFIKIGLEYAPPFAFGALRIVLSSILLTGIILVIARRGPRWDRTQGWVLLLGCLNIGGLMIGMNLGLTVVSAGEGSVLIYTQPLMVALLAHVFLGERLTGGRLIGVLTGFVGMVIALSDRIRPGENPAWWGYLLLLGGALSWSAATVLFKRLQGRLDLMWTVVLQNLYGSLPLLILVAAVERRPIVWAPEFVILTVGLAFFSAALAYLIWFYLLSQGAASSVSAYLFLVPVFGVLSSAVVLNERPGPAVLFGGLLIMAGIYLVNRTPRRPPSITPSPLAPESRNVQSVGPRVRS